MRCTMFAKRQAVVTTVLSMFLVFASAEPDDRNKTLAALQKSTADSIFSSYSREDRPTVNGSEDAPVEVSIAGEPIDEIEEDVVSQTIGFSVLLCSEWLDPRLKWNVTAFPRSSMFVRYWRLWTPDVRFINSVSSSEELSLPTLIRDTGMAIECNKYRVVIPCSLDLRAFPHDVHNCTMKIGSVLHNSEDTIFTVNPYNFGRPFKYGPWEVDIFSEIKEEDNSVAKRSLYCLTLQLTRKFDVRGVPIYLALWASVLLVALTLLASEDHQRPLSCVVLLGISVQHSFLVTLIKGATNTPVILMISSGIMAVCFVMVCSLHVRMGFRSKVTKTSMAMLTESILPIFEMTVLLPASGLLAIALLFA